MKKLFLSLFLLAFISVGFSAPPIIKADNDVKKEVVKTSTVLQVDAISVEMPFSKVQLFKQNNDSQSVVAIFTIITNDVFVESHWPNPEPGYHCLSPIRYNPKQVAFEESPHISG